MRFASIDGRSHLNVGPGQYVDVATASGNSLPSDPHECLLRWEELKGWAATRRWTASEVTEAADSRLDPPVPRPRQILAVGLNYAQHAEETGLRGNDIAPLTFTKFASSITAPVSDLRLPSPTVDWEVELVVVVGREARHVAVDEAWDAVAGLTLGQDLSERTSQMAGNPPQFSLAKSHEGFAPIGPHMVTTDEFPDLDDITIECRVNDRLVQQGSTRQLVHSVPELIAYYSSICTLYPGDLIFTGTPDGVGMGRTPAEYLRDGDELVSESTHIGTLRQRCRAADGRKAGQ